MNEDEQKQLGQTPAETATATTTAPAPAPVPAPVGVGVDAFDAASKAGANMVGSAIDAATAPGQSVVDAARNAETESQLRGVAQAVTAADRYRATQSGMESPPSAWAQDVNDLYAGLTRAAQRSAERLAQPQQGQETQQKTAFKQDKVAETPQPLSIGKDGRVKVGSGPDESDPLSRPIDASSINNTRSKEQDAFDQEVGAIFGL